MIAALSIAQNNVRALKRDFKVWKVRELGTAHVPIQPRRIE